MAYRIESLLSARLFLAPQHAGGRLYFVSDLSGRLSLYAMDSGGSVPEPLLPPHIALQNPDLIGGAAFRVFPRLGKILVMIDKDGDENYQPMLVPIGGGFPEPAFGGVFAGYRCHLGPSDLAKGLAYVFAERRDSPLQETWRASLATGKAGKMAESTWGMFPMAHNASHGAVLLAEEYTVGDSVLYLARGESLTPLFGKPRGDRAEGEVVPPTGIHSAVFSPSGKGAIVVTAVFDDHFGLGHVRLSRPGRLAPIAVRGLAHSGEGELEEVEEAGGGRFLLQYNIDGCSWVYEATFDEERLVMTCRHVLVGQGVLEGGKLDHLDHDAEDDLYVASFSTATSPGQIFTIEGKSRSKVFVHTAERVLGIPDGMLSEGEDASFVSHDGLRVSARLYLPAASLGYEGARPLVYYIHGGPQGQERPDFAWFSMPLIQYLTLRGFAVFVPNARGSTGYGLGYTTRVDRDWGGQDRLDHVHAMTKVLPKDPRVDSSRAAVMGRSYGGYMTLTLAGRHPELWKAACDMFGPYDLVKFIERLPETWKPYFKIAVGDADKPEERDFLVERSPKTWLHRLAAPMLVIQGRNDPRVVAMESEELVRELKAKGKDMELLVFENEGHDVLKYENKVRCYETIAEFLSRKLSP